LADAAYQFFEHRAYLPCIGIILILAELLMGRGSLPMKPGFVRFTVLLLAVFSGLTFIHCRDYRDPASFFQSAIEGNPQSAMAYNNRGAAKFYQGDLFGAMTDIAQAIAIKPDYAQAYYNRALIYGQTQSYPAALSDYDRSIQLDSAKPMVWFNRAIVKWITRDLHGSLRDCEKSMQLLPGFWIWYFHRGNLETDLGEYGRALNDYDSAIASFSGGKGYNNSMYNTVINNTTTESDIFCNRAKVLQLTGKLTEAIADCDRALVYNPKNAGALYYRALARSGMKDDAGALGDFNASIDLDGRQSVAWYDRGTLKFRIHDLPGACNDLRRSKSLGYPKADSLIGLSCGKN
jgi:tetratricopeptide (TPR) repeat protein